MVASRSHDRVEPSTSVNKNVTVPDGRSFTKSASARALINENGTSARAGPGHERAPRDRYRVPCAMTGARHPDDLRNPRATVVEQRCPKPTGSQPTATRRWPDPAALCPYRSSDRPLTTTTRHADTLLQRHPTRLCPTLHAQPPWGTPPALSVRTLGAVLHVGVASLGERVESACADNVAGDGAVDEWAGGARSAACGQDRGRSRPSGDAARRAPGVR